MNDATKAPELLPCPFCGKRARTHYIRDGRQAYCTVCHAGGPPVFHGPLGVRETEELAIAAWNRRATPAALIREAEARGRMAGIEDVIEAMQHKVAMWSEDDDLWDWVKPGMTLIAEASALRGEKEPK